MLRPYKPGVCSQDLVLGNFEAHLVAANLPGAQDTWAVLSMILVNWSLD